MLSNMDLQSQLFWLEITGMAFSVRTPSHSRSTSRLLRCKQLQYHYTPLVEKEKSLGSA